MSETKLKADLKPDGKIELEKINPTVLEHFFEKVVFEPMNTPDQAIHSEVNLNPRVWERVNVITGRGKLIFFMASFLDFFEKCLFKIFS